MIENGKTRIEKWDNIKFFLIFLVVLGHIADIYADVSFATGCLRFIIYTFHMPLFIYISGLFSKKNINEKRYLNIFSYLILYLFIKIINFFAQWAANGTKPGFKLFYAASVPWYAFALFAFSMITILIKNISPKYILILSVIIACIAGYDGSIRDFLCISRIIVFFPFFYLGYITDPEKIGRKLSDKKFIPFAVLVFAIITAVTIIFYDEIKDLKFLFTGRNPYSVFVKNCPYAFIFRLLCYAVSLLAGASFIVLIPEKIGKSGKIAALGKRSVQIYSLHFALKYLYFGFTNNRFGIEKLFVSKLLIYEFIIAVVITAICALPFWEPFFKKLMHIPLKTDN